MTKNTDPRVKALGDKLLFWARTSDEISASRAALAELRHALPERERLRAAPYVAPFLGANDARDEHWFYLVAALFATHRLHAPGRSLGHAFRALKDKSDGMETRFLHLLSADERRLPDLLRHAVSLLAAQSPPVPLDWYKLLEHVLGWNAPDKPRQHQLARDFYANSASQDADTKGTPDAELQD